MSLTRVVDTFGVLEAQHLGAGTSGSSFAWTNANRKTPDTYFRLNVFGMAELRSRVERLRAWGYASELINRADIAHLEPDTVPPPRLEHAAHFPTEG